MAKTKEDEYLALGKAVAQFYESGALSKSKTLKMSFLKGLVSGLGGVLGATVVLALLLWILSLFDNLPLIDDIVRTIRTNS